MVMVLVQVYKIYNSQAYFLQGLKFTVSLQVSEVHKSDGRLIKEKVQVNTNKKWKR
jgi:hypothetical protein